MSTLADALADLRAGRHKTTAGDIRRLVAQARVRNAIGFWADGAELSHIVHVPDPAALAVTAARLGKHFNQKAVVSFAASPDGPDLLHRIALPGAGLQEAHQRLADAGLEYHTLLSRPGGVLAHVLDPGGELRAKVAAVGRHQSTPGHVEFIGADTRDEARQVYDRVLGAGGPHKLSRPPEGDPDLAGFHQAIAANPDDRTTHQVYADFLQDRGHPGAAEVVRDGEFDLIHTALHQYDRGLAPGQHTVRVFRDGPQFSVLVRQQAAHDPELVMRWRKFGLDRDAVRRVTDGETLDHDHASPRV